MKKILIAVTLLALSSTTAFAKNTAPCQGNPHYCSEGSVSNDDFVADQQRQDAEIATKADKSALNDVSVKTDHAFNIAVEGRATANNALSTVYGLIPQVLDNGKKITDVDNKVNANKAQTDASLNTKVDKDTQAARDSAQDDHINAVQGAAQTANDRATDLEHRADAAEGAIRETNDQLAVTDGRSINNAERLDGVETKNAEQDTAIAGKVDKSTYAVDKAKQAFHDAAQDVAIVGLAVTKADKSDLNKETADRVKGDKALDDKINKAVSDQASTDNAQNAAIGKEGTDRQNADNALKNNIDQNKAEQANTDAKQDKALSTETDNRIAGDKALKANIDKNKSDQAVTDSNQDKVIATKASKKELASETASRKSADAKLSSRIDSNDATLVQHDQRITSNTKRIGSVEGRVSNLEQSTNKRFADVDKRIGDNRKVASAGIAGAGAMANIPQVTQNGNFSVGAGIGGYDGEQAVAVGFSARVTNSVTTKVSVSTNTQSEVLWGAGVGVEW